jgi:hypothetical protein
MIYAQIFNFIFFVFSLIHLIRVTFLGSFRFVFHLAYVSATKG